MHSAIDLMKGAWYALEQSGCLLRDATNLHDCRSFASGIALAMLAREELGKHVLLLELYGAAKGGKVFNEQDIAASLEDHRKKQSAGQLSVVLRANAGTPLGAAMRDALHSDTAAAMATQAMEAKQKRDPEARRQLRERSLYVDPESAGGWSRPCMTAPATAQSAIDDAVNDYAGQRDRLLRLISGEPEPHLSRDSPDLAADLRGWTDRPDLCPPRWTAIPELM